MHIRYGISIAVALVVTGSAAFAQSNGEGWQIGLAAGASTSPLVGEDSSVGALPLIAYQGDRFSIGFSGVELTAFDQNGQSIDLLLSPRTSDIDDADSAALAGMDRDLTFDIGLRYSQSLMSGGELAITALHEITGEHDGQEVDVRLSQPIGNVPVALYAGATWQSAGLTEYLYGVMPNEATGSRPAYAPGGAITPYVGLGGAVPLNQSMSLIGNVQASYLSDTITDSPIVEDEAVISGSVGIMFSF